MNILLFNIFLYALWFLLSFKIEKRITVYSFLILFYLGLAVCGYYSVNEGIYYDTFGYYSLKSLKITPYILAFVAYIILFMPFYKVRCNIKNVDFIFCNKTRLFLKYWIVVYLLYTILKLTEAVATMSMGLAAAYDARHNDGVSLFQYNPILAKFNGYSYFFLQATVPFVMLYALFGMKKKIISTKYSLLLISLCFLPSFFESLGMGSRGGMFMTFFCFLFFVFLLYDQLSKKFIRTISKVAIIFVGVILFYSWAITVDRIGDSTGLDSIIRYFGESFPNLGWTVWDNAYYHPMGERFFPELFNSKVALLSVGDAYDYWQKMTGVPILTFKTYFGDLYVEFGTLGAFIFLFCSSGILYIYLNRKGISIFNIGYCYFYYQLCVFAFSGYTKTGWNSIFQLLIITIFVIFIKNMYNSSKRIER